MTQLLRSRHCLGVTVIAAVLGFLSVLSNLATTASATGINQGIVVPVLRYPTAGQALPWQPGTNANVGVLDLTLTDRGLLAGQGVDRSSTFLVGRSGFFDLAPPGPDVIAPELSILSPRDQAAPLAVSEISGIAFDDRRIQRVNVRLRNLDTGQYLRANGSFANGLVNLSPPTTFSGLGSAEWILDTPDLAPDNYQARWFPNDDYGSEQRWWRCDSSWQPQLYCDVEQRQCRVGLGRRSERERVPSSCQRHLYLDGQPIAAALSFGARSGRALRSGQQQGHQRFQYRPTDALSRQVPREGIRRQMRGS